MSESKSLHHITTETSAKTRGKLYRGERSGSKVSVTVNGGALVSRSQLRNHSPTGFEWGYGGSGPAQLALALLADHLGETTRVLELYQDFKRKVVALLPHDGWTLTSAQIDRTLTEIESESTPR